MTSHRKRIDPLAAMAAANPSSAAELRAEMGEAGLEQALARTLALGRAPSPPVPAPGRSARRPRRRRIALPIGFAAAALLAAIVIAASWLGGPGSGRPEFAAAAIRVAEANPRLLVTAPGWRITRADQFEPDSGELTFSDGSHRFELHWYPARMYRSYLHDRADVSAPERGTLLGQRTTTVEYGRGEYATMLSPQGSVFIEVRGLGVRGGLGSRRAYDRILRSLEPVDVRTWLAAMPPTTVRPDARAEAVDQMLRGIPLPPTFDAAPLREEDSISDRSSLAVTVGNAIACAWVQSWIAAQATGDEAAASEAVQAIASSPNWPIVRTTKVPWFSNYHIVTRQLRAGRLNRGLSGEYMQTPDGRTFGYGPAWKLTLGCKGTYRREVEGIPGGP